MAIPPECVKATIGVFHTLGKNKMPDWNTEAQANISEEDALTIRMEDELKSKAAKQAEKLGVPLTLIVKNALRNFVEAPKIGIGEPETIIVTPDIQAKMDEIAELLSKK